MSPLVETGPFMVDTPDSADLALLFKPIGTAAVTRKRPSDEVLQHQTLTNNVVTLLGLRPEVFPLRACGAYDEEEFTSLGSFIQLIDKMEFSSVPSLTNREDVTPQDLLQALRTHGDSALHSFKSKTIDQPHEANQICTSLSLAAGRGTPIDWKSVAMAQEGDDADLPEELLVEIEATAKDSQNKSLRDPANQWQHVTCSQTSASRRTPPLCHHPHNFTLARRLR
jgi:hypothetical protein